jgi:hypothetical protein
MTVMKITQTEITWRPIMMTITTIQGAVTVIFMMTTPVNMISATATVRTVRVLKDNIHSNTAALRKEETATKDRTIPSAMRIILPGGIINTLIPTGIHHVETIPIRRIIMTGINPTEINVLMAAVTVPIHQEEMEKQENHVTEDTAHQMVTVQEAVPIIIHRVATATVMKETGVMAHLMEIPEEVIMIPIHRSAIAVMTETHYATENTVLTVQNVQEEETVLKVQAVTINCILSEAMTLPAATAVEKNAGHRTAVHTIIMMDSMRTLIARKEMVLIPIKDVPVQVRVLNQWIKTGCVKFLLKAEGIRTRGPEDILIVVTNSFKNKHYL